jgi:hypothetical protein
LGSILVWVIFILVGSGKYYLVVGKLAGKFLDLEILGKIGALTFGLYFGLGDFDLSRLS